MGQSVPPHNDGSLSSTAMWPKNTALFSTLHTASVVMQFIFTTLDRYWKQV